MSATNSSSNTLKINILEGNPVENSTLKDSTLEEPENEAINEAITENHLFSQSHSGSHRTSEKVELGTAPGSSFNALAFSSQQRHLVTQAGQQQLAFPLQWVSEIMLVEQSHILALPFYDPMLFGVLHDKGDIVPLLVAPLAGKAETAAFIQSLKTKRTLTAVRLNRAAGRLAGVGLVVDRVIERTAAESSSSVRIFQLEDIPSTVWQPR